MTETSDVSALRAELETASAGLPYVSEGDYPFDFVTFAGTAADLSPERIGAVVGRPGEEASEVTLERFFQHHIENVDPNDPVGVAAAGRYQALRDGLRERMPDVRVFRIGAPRVECYLIGSAGGGLAGLHTTAIET